MQRSPTTPISPSINNENISESMLITSEYKYSESESEIIDVKVEDVPRDVYTQVFTKIRAEQTRVNNEIKFQQERAREKLAQEVGLQKSKFKDFVTEIFQPQATFIAALQDESIAKIDLLNVSQSELEKTLLGTTKLEEFNRLDRHIDKVKENIAKEEQTKVNRINSYNAYIAEQEKVFTEILELTETYTNDTLGIYKAYSGNQLGIDAVSKSETDGKKRVLDDLEKQLQEDLEQHRLRLLIQKEDTLAYHKDSLQEKFAALQKTLSKEQQQALADQETQRVAALGVLNDIFVSKLSNLEKDIQNAALVAEGKKVVTGNDCIDFPWRTYNSYSVLVGTCVAVDVLYTVFLGYVGNKSIAYLGDFTPTAPINAAMIALRLYNLASNLWCDVIATVSIPTEASGLTFAEPRLKKAFEAHPSLGVASQSAARLTYAAMQVISFVSYLGLSTPDGVSLEIFGASNPVIYAGCVIFGLAGPTYYSLMLNGKLAEHIAWLLDDGRKIAKQAFKQPLMALEASNEVLIMAAVRTTLASFGVIEFLTDPSSINLASNHPITKGALSAVAAATFLNASLTRTKKPIVDYLRHSDLTYLNFKVNPAPGVVFSIETGPLIRNYGKAKEHLKKGEIARDLLESFARGTTMTGLLRKFTGLPIAGLIGGTMMTLAAYAKLTRRLANATETVILEEQKAAEVAAAASEEKSEIKEAISEQILSFAEQEAKIKQEEWAKIVELTKDKRMDGAMRNRNAAARVDRLVSFFLSIHDLNQQMLDLGVYLYFGWNACFDKEEEIFLSAFLSLPYFINEYYNYQPNIKETYPDTIARINFANYMIDKGGVTSKRVRAELITWFLRQPAESFINSELQEYRAHLDAKLAEKMQVEATKPAEKLSMWARLFSSCNTSNQQVANDETVSNDYHALENKM